MPFVSYFKYVNVEENDFLQASNTHCHALCLHTMKVILDCNQTILNIIELKLNVDYQNEKTENNCFENGLEIATENFQKEYRNINSEKKLFTDKVEKNIVKVKQSQNYGDPKFSKIASEHKDGKYFPNKYNQKLSDFTEKWKSKSDDNLPINNDLKNL